MKWAVLVFNILTIGILAYVVYTQVDELKYYEGIENESIKIAKAIEASNAAVTTDSALETDGEEPTPPAEQPAEGTVDAE